MRDPSRVTQVTRVTQVSLDTPGRWSLTGKPRTDFLTDVLAELHFVFELRRVRSLEPIRIPMGAAVALLSRFVEPLRSLPAIARHAKAELIGQTQGKFRLAKLLLGALAVELAALTSSFGSPPSPSSYILPRAYCEARFPWAAAFANHEAACRSSFGNPASPP